MSKRGIMLFLSIIMLFVAQGQKEKRLKVLIVDGFNNHDWVQTTRLTKAILEGSRLFAVTVNTVPADSAERARWFPDFNQYAVVIQNTNNINDEKVRWPVQVEKSLETFVKNGGGLYILHAANNAFPHWHEYEKMIGLGWRPKSFGYALEITPEKIIKRIPPGEGENTGHGRKFNAVVEKYTAHPLNEGYPNRWTTANTEVYNYPRGLAENLTILSYTFDSTATQKYWPMEWLVKYGQGNVYNTSLGHIWDGDVSPENYRCVGFQTTLIRAVEWLGTGRITYKIPYNFPTGEKVSLQ